MKKPNIILIQTDSHDGRAMGCMGHPSLQGITDHMDELAQKGTFYTQSYCNNPICCPSRASMFSGLFTHNCEAWNNFKGLKETDPTFLDALKSAGYQMNILGKTDYVEGHHTIRARVSPWTRSANIARPNYNMRGPKVRPTQETRVLEKDWKNVDKTIEVFEKQKDKQDPFFIYIGINQPHPPFETSEYYLNKVDPAKVTIPTLKEADHPAINYQRINKNWTHGFDDEMILLIRRIYFALIAEVDEMLGTIMKGLRDNQLEEDTYIIFTSDHGEFALEHRQFYKMSPYEPSARVPLIITGPNVKAQKIDRVTSLIDIYPTLMSMANITQYPDNLDGTNLVPELEGKPSEHPPWVLMQFHGTTVNTGVFMLREDHYKYVAYVGYPSQLFDLNNDPNELNDISKDHPEIVAKMDQKLKTIVDYEAVDKKVKAYDRQAFGKWREEQKKAGKYDELMSRVYSGWDELKEGEGDGWSEEDEQKIVKWLAGTV